MGRTDDWEETPPPETLWAEFERLGEWVVLKPDAAVSPGSDDGPASTAPRRLEFVDDVDSGRLRISCGWVSAEDVLTLPQAIPRAEAELRTDERGGSAAGWVEVGGWRLLAEEYDEAISSFEAALARDPNSAEARLGLAEARIARDESLHWAARGPALAAAVEEGIAAAEFVLQSDPKSARAMFLRGDCVRRRGAAAADLHDGAAAGFGEEADWDAVLRRSASSGGAEELRLACEVHLRRAVAYAAKGWKSPECYALAFAEFDAALAIDPWHAYVRLRRGLWKLKSGDLDGALADYDETLRRTPKHAGAWILRGEACFEHGRVFEARAAFQAAVVLHPSQALAVIGNSLFGCGMDRHRKHDYDWAVAATDLALELGCDRKAALRSREMYQRYRGDFAGALIAAQELARSKGTDPPAHQSRAAFHTILGNHRAAAEELTAALEQWPTWPAYLLQRAETHAQLGNHAAAGADADAAVEIAPNSLHARLARAAVRNRIGDYLGALSDCTAAAAFEPDDDEIRKARAAAFRGLGDVEGALVELRALAERDSAGNEGRIGPARLLLEVGRTKEGLDALQEAVRLSPKSVWLYSEASRLYLSADDVAAAAVEADQAVECCVPMPDERPFAPYRYLAFFQRARVRERQARFDEALADLAEALRNRPCEL